MAKTFDLINGFKYLVVAGAYEGEVVTIMDRTTFPDSHPQARKVTVTLSNGDIEYILPRMLSDTPVDIDNPAIKAQAPAQVAIPTNIAPPLAADAALTTVAAPASLAQLALSDAVKPITDPMDSRLDQFRPNRSKIKRYIPRIMDEETGMTDIEFFLHFTDDGYRAENELRPANIMLKGDTQSGKTFLVEVLAWEWAKKLGYDKPMPIFTLSGSSGVTDYDLFGQTTSFTDEYGVERLVWLPGIADLAARVGGILYLDELNAMTERVTSSLFPLADHRHQFINRNKAVVKDGVFMPEVVTGHVDLWIIATFNEGYKGMGDIPEAFNNRCRTVLWDYDKAIEGKLVKSLTIHLLADRLRTARKAMKIKTPVGTAALQRLERDVKTFGPARALATLLGMFKAGERDIVETIIEDSSIEVLIAEEIRQQQLNDDAANDAANDDGIGSGTITGRVES